MADGSGRGAGRAVTIGLGVIVILVRLLSCAAEESRREAANEATGRQLAESLGWMDSPPEWAGCPLELGVSDEGRPEGGLDAVRMAVADVRERTGFDIQFLDAPDDARLWVLWEDPGSLVGPDAVADAPPTVAPELPEDDGGPPASGEAPTVDGREMVTFITHTTGVARNAGLALDPGLPPDRLLWQLRRGLGAVLTGEVDMISPPPLPSATTTSTTPDLFADPPYDVDAVAAAARSCTPMEDIAGTERP